MKTLTIDNKHYQECDVVMLPTKNKALLYTKSNGNLANHNSLATMPLDSIGSNQHLYILSNDEIKDGDWYYQYNPFGSVIGKCDDKSPFVAKSSRYIWENKGKKIIATTDSSVKYPERFPSFVTLPQIPQSFIEHFIDSYNKGNVISKVLVEVEGGCLNFENGICTEMCDNMFCRANLKLNQNNEISILTEQKQMFSREEVEDLIWNYKNCVNKNEFINTDNWIKENLK